MRLIRIGTNVNSFVTLSPAKRKEYIGKLIEEIDLYLKIYNKDNVGDDDIYIEGHTHKSKIIKENNKIIINPGSISKPRGNTYKSYIIIKNNIIYLKDIYGNIIETTKIK